MSLDVYLRETVFDANITHNMVEMAKEAGIYKCVWRPEDVGIYMAGELIKPLRTAIEAMKNDPDRFKRHNPENGWGDYDMFLAWLEEYLDACKKNPEAQIHVSR